MPLPPNTTLSLHGYSKPGDTIQSKPKQAMIIRMSAETLDALEDFPNQPPLQFEFGDTTGIWIGDTFFPMRSEKESGSHELYLRASTAAKPTAPLKLHANIIGKFMVERELGEKAENKVRESTRAAENTRTQRQTIRLDGPPPDLTIPRKSKATTDSMFRKPIRASDHLRNNTASSSSSSASTRLPPKPAAPSPQAKPPVKEQLPARARLVHYLAIRDRTKEEILRIIGGPDCDRANRSRILDLLDELAEPTQKKDVFTLKLKSWLEVRPLEWSSLTEEERIAMCRSARKALVDMKIPRSEAAWDHIKLPVKGAPRPSLPTAGPSKATVAQRAVNEEPPKRGLSSKDVKEKKAAKSKADATARGKTEIRMKDESVKASPRPTAVKRDPDAMDWTSTTTTARNSASTSKPVATATTSATRKVPGSGFKTGISTSQDSRSEAPERSRASPIPRNKPANGRAPPTAKAVAPATATVEEKKYGLGAGANVRIKKIKTDSDGIDRERSVERSKGPETSPTLKRKKPVKEEEEEEIPRSNASLTKRRKTEESPRPVPVPSASTSAVPRAKDLSLPKKPTVPIPGRAIKKEPSPLNPPIPNKTTKKTSPLQQSTVPSSSSLPQHHTERRGSSKLSASSKSRRKSPIYTSSEDEDQDQDQDQDEIRRPEKQRDVLVLPTPSTATSNSSGSSSAGTSSRARPSQTPLPLPLPKDHAGLRSRYRTTYKDYLATFQKLVAQQDKIETLLGHGGGDSVTVTDSDGDLMDTDDLSRLSEDHKRLSEELVCIRRIFGSPPSS